LKKLYTLKSKPAYEAAKKTFNGRTHFVLPITLLVEGVHHAGNAEVPYYYPADALSFLPEVWADTCVLINHPKEITANTVNVHEREVLGRLFEPGYDNGLKSELWLDEERLKEKDPELHTRIENGEEIEVSTGVYLELLEEKGTWNGEEYGAKVLRLWPDHLAILPVDKGACSIDDGCGIRNEGKKTLNIMSSARRPDFNGVEAVSWYDTDRSFAAYRNGYYVHTGTPIPPTLPVTLAEAPKEMKRWIASKTLLGNPDSDDADAVMAYPVVNPETNKLNQSALLKVINADSWEYHWVNPPDSVKQSANNMAMTLLVAEFGLELKANNEGFVSKIVNKIKELISNKEDCKCQNHDPENPGTEVNQMDRKKVIAALIANKHYTEEDRKTLEAFDDKHIAVLAKLCDENPEHKPEDKKEEPEKKVEIPPADAAKPNPEEQKPQTEEEYINSAPEGIRDVLKEGLNIRKAKKAQLVAAIKGNAANKFSEDALNAKSIEELENLAALAHVEVDYSLNGSGSSPTENDEAPEPTPVFLAPKAANQ
jgi:hypothetical protein